MRIEDVFADSEGDDEQSDSGSAASSSWTIPGGPWLLTALFVGALVFTLLKNKKIVRYYTLQRFIRRRDEAAFIPAYERLLWLLQYVGYKRNSGETLREYAKRMDSHFQTNEMLLLTAEYERVIYGGKKLDASWTAQKSNWESLIRKIES